MQSHFHPNSTNSLQLSFDGPPSALQFYGDFAVLGPIKLKQYDLFHRVVSKRVEQLGAALQNFSQDIGRRPADSRLRGISDSSSLA